MVWEALKLALQSVRRNPLRSILTLLGIVIGVAAVIAMVTIGDGTTRKVEEDLTKLGSNMLVARPGRNVFGPGGNSDSRAFKDRDIVALRAGLSRVRAIAPVSSRAATIVSGAQNYSTTVNGADSDFFVAQDWSFESGRPFSDGEVRSGSAVCVIGQTVKTVLFGPMDPLGERVRIGNVSCGVIGVLIGKGQSAMGTDQDNTVIMPLRAFQRRISGNTNIQTVYIAVDAQDQIAAMQASAERILRDQRRITAGEDDDFSVRDMTQIISAMTSTTSLMTALLGAVAAVSLLVGGIGVMNIMLVSVTERTREIGIRLAIGALEGQVLTQFLVEAFVLALLGGILGIGLGLALAALAAHGMGIPFAPSAFIIALSFAFSGAIGIVFGYFPARRAARLDPIEALRHE
jgi:putative ABC transport system permease protein